MHTILVHVVKASATPVPHNKYVELPRPVYSPVCFGVTAPIDQGTSSPGTPGYAENRR